MRVCFLLLLALALPLVGVHRVVGSEALTERIYLPMLAGGSATSGWLVQAVDSDGATTCAIDSSDQLYCWGVNSSGQVGNGTTTPQDTPMRVDLPAAVQQVVVIGKNTTALLADGTVWSWGCNVTGKLGDGTRSTGPLGTCNGVNKPQRVGTAAAPLSDVVEIASSNLTTAARTGNGDIFVWGGVDVIGKPAAPRAPTRVGTNTGATSIGIGPDMYCFARIDGSYDCVSPYGRQSAIYARQYISERIPADSRVLAIFGSSQDICVLRTEPNSQDEVITCMGWTYSSYTVDPPRPSSTFAIAAPRSATVVGTLAVVTSTGEERSYGRNGLETKTPAGLVALRPFSDYATASGGAAGCVVRASGELWCWDAGSALTRVTP